MTFPTFWYESNPCWGNVNSLEDLSDKMRLQLEENNGIDTIDSFLDRSKQCGNTMNFGTRREHDGPKTLRMLLDEHDLLEDFIELNKIADEHQDPDVEYDLDDRQDMCQRCGKNHGMELHTCPYKRELADDDTLCNCCTSCKGDCADEV